MRIGIIGLNYAPETTGIAPYTTGLARHLAAEGHDVTVVTGHPHYPQWALHPGYERPRPPRRDQGVHVVRVPHPVPTRVHGVQRIWMEIVFAARAGGHLLRVKPDVALAVSPALLSLVPAVLLRRIGRYRVGVVVQDLYGAALAETGVSGGLLSNLTARLEKLLLRRADRITVIHDVHRRRLIAMGIPSARIAAIPNWSHVTVPDVDRAAVRRDLGWAPDDFVALHAGNMGAKQGLEGLIDVGRLAERQRSRVRVVLMGDGSRRAALADYATGLSSVSLVESLPEGRFEAALAAADCLLLHEAPGIVEMCVPSKLTSYFQAGRPVVAATDERSGAAALMSLSGAGLTVPSGDAAALLSAAESLAADAAAAKEMGEKGRAFAFEHLAASRSLALYLDWVEALGGRPREPGMEAAELKPAG